MEEVWKDIAGYEGLYQVSNLGRVKRIPAKLRAKDGKVYFRRGAILKPNIKKDSRAIIHLSKNNSRIAKLIYRLVAETFIPNPENKPQVNHIDGDPSNNCVSNLEWVTQKENMRHSIYTLDNKPRFGKKAVKCIETGKEYLSMCEASRDTGVQQSDISRIANKAKGRKTAGGYHWEYVD